MKSKITRAVLACATGLVLVVGSSSFAKAPKTPPKVAPPVVERTFMRCGFKVRGAPQTVLPRFINILLSKRITQVLPTDPILSNDEDGLLAGKTFISFEPKPIPGQPIRYMLLTGPAANPQSTLLLLMGTGSNSRFEAGLGEIGTATRYEGNCAAVHGPAAESRYRFFLPAGQ